MEDPIRKRLEEKFTAGEDLVKLDAELDNVIKSKVNLATSNMLKVCIPEGLLKRFPKNNISAMVLTGAKGGLVNMT
jgi:DNA-directed RNA polymerase I subunit RPA1